VDDEGNKSGHFCTGFMVDAARGLILTAEHCVSKDNQGVFVDGLEAEVIKKNHDLAVIKVEPFSRPALDIETSSEIGDPVTAIGYGYGDLFRLKRSIAGTEIADGKRKSDLECDLFALDGPVAPGMSGGPIINAKGKVIGITQATAPAIGLGCKAKEINKFLKEVK
jgi:S1-C subfamily serine protease